MSRAADLLAWEESYLGFAETPVNRTIFALMAGVPDGQAWCGTFQIAALRSAGVPIPAGAASPYTPTMYAGFKRDGRVFETPAVGDLGFVFYRSLGRIGHVFAVREVDEPGRTVRTIEGNANGTASRSGGEVASLFRSYASRSGGAYIYGFARPAYDDRPVTLANLPVRATHTGAIVVPAALVTHAAVSTLTVDGDLGPETIRRLQHVLGAGEDGVLGPDTIGRLQRALNLAVGARLAADGKITQDAPGGSATVRALQGYLGTPRDGVISHPHSEVVAALQRRLNAGTLFSALRSTLST